MNSPNPKDALLAVLVVSLAVTALEPGAVNALPGFSDHTGPSEMRVTSLERLDAGCRDSVANYARGSVSGGTYTRVTFIETDDPDADLSAWVERTSPPGADLSTFRVYVESHASEASEVASATTDDCETGVQYRIEATTSGGSPAGVLPDAHGVRVRWFENGEEAGCSGSYTSSLRGGCGQFREDERPDRTWANATTKL
ncbi:hypothetical protein [Halorussus caseinilyticus]|uniref:Uncharacterized protein n=1 Tax=Halorussus caseinilyticus TaxID=3034025 RepID=A0ABD5WJ13_9EURY|nr:hypothetical protein [Halorussus sp. DT72]